MTATREAGERALMPLWAVLIPWGLAALVFCVAWHKARARRRGRW